MPTSVPTHSLTRLLCGVWWILVWVRSIHPSIHPSVHACTRACILQAQAIKEHMEALARERQALRQAAGADAPPAPSTTLTLKPANLPGGRLTKVRAHFNKPRFKENSPAVCSVRCSFAVDTVKDPALRGLLARVAAELHDAAPAAARSDGGGGGGKKDDNGGATTTTAAAPAPAPAPAVIAAADPDPDRQAEAGLLVPRSQVGTLIGRRGANIMRIQEESGGALIKIDQDTRENVTVRGLSLIHI